MSNDTQQHFTESAIMACGGQRIAQEPFELGERAFDLPALAKHFSREFVLHFQAVVARFHRTVEAALVNWNSGSLNTQFFAAKHVKRFAVTGRISRQGRQLQVGRRLFHCLWKVSRIVAGPHADDGGRNQVRLMFTDHGQLDPAPVAFHAPAAFQKVATDITARKSCGIEGSSGSGRQQSPLVGVFKHSVQEAVKGPFFSSLFSAFWSVVK